jgi:hypothetical protein
MWDEVGFPALLVACQRSGSLGGDPSVKFEASRRGMQCRNLEQILVCTRKDLIGSLVLARDGFLALQL